MAALRGARGWFERHRQTMLITNAVSIALLLMMHVYAAAVPTYSQQVGNAVSMTAIVLASIILLGVAWRGVVPAVICALGLVLVHNSLILPYFAPAGPQYPDFRFNNHTLIQPPSSAVAAFVATQMYFILGLFMVGLAMAVAFRPSILSTRNQPVPADDLWSCYPIWRDSILEGRHAEPSVPATSLMDERDRYLMWRYEYVLADIYGRPHLVRPSGLVPKKSTAFVRDGISGLLVGKARFNSM
jgi:hypothetical protein